MLHVEESFFVLVVFFMQWLANLLPPCVVPCWRRCFCCVVRLWVTSSWVPMLVICRAWLTSAFTSLRPCWLHYLVFSPLSTPFPPRSRVGGQRHSRDLAGCMLDLLVVRRLPLAAFEFMLLGRDGPLHSALSACGPLSHRRGYTRQAKNTMN